MLRWARERAGLEREDAARLLKISEERMQSWEENTHLPPYYKLKALRNASIFHSDTCIIRNHLTLVFLCPTLEPLGMKEFSNQVRNSLP
jgi:transcriptional regulator with XRE-family HTH domain